MLKLGRIAKVIVLFLVLVFVFNFDLFKFSAAILEKGLFASKYKQGNVQVRRILGNYQDDISRSTTIALTE